MSGGSEFLVNVNAKTMREVADFVGEKLAPVEGVSQTTTMFILKKYKVNGVAMDLEPEVEDEVVAELLGVDRRRGVLDVVSQVRQQRCGRAQRGLGGLVDRHRTGDLAEHTNPETS